MLIIKHHAATFSLAAGCTPTQLTREEKNEIGENCRTTKEIEKH